MSFFESFIEGLPFLNPGSRLYFLSMILSGLVAVGYFLKKGMTSYYKRTLVDYWLSPSALVDYQVISINLIIKVLFFTPFLGLSYYFSKLIIKILYQCFGTFGTLENQPLVIFSATLFVFATDDFLRFFHHYLMHKIPFLWSIHKTHHSATTLTPLTLYRIHPIESMMATIRNSFSVGLTSGLLIFAFSSQANLYTLFGVNAFGFMLNSIFGNLRHSHVALSFGVLERLFISPKQHQIHHSNKVEHYDKNFGVSFSIWDQVMGTYLSSKNQESFSFGVDDLSSTHLINQYVRISKIEKIKGSNGFQPHPKGLH